MVYGAYPGIELRQRGSTKVDAEVDALIVLRTGAIIVDECKTNVRGLANGELIKLWYAAHQIGARATFANLVELQVIPGGGVQVYTDAQRVGATLVNFAADDPEGHIDELKRRGLPAECNHRCQQRRSAVTITDPDNNTIRLIARSGAVLEARRRHVAHGFARLILSSGHIGSRWETPAKIHVLEYLRCAVSTE